MRKLEKPLVWLHGEVKTPPFSTDARIEAGVLLRRLQRGESISLPHSRPMPSIGKACHELRIQDEAGTWRIVYHIDVESIVILEVFSKTTQQTPKRVMDTCTARLRRYQSI
jgi:phage-related protein